MRDAIQRLVHEPKRGLETATARARAFFERGAM